MRNRQRSAPAPDRRRPRPRRSPQAGLFFGGFTIGVFCACVFVALVFFLLYGPAPAASPRSVTPIPLPKIMDLPQLQGDQKERLFWGTYRPHVYLGIRARIPKSLLAGLMWLGVKDGYYRLRHTCEDSDGLTRYGWVRHDGVAYGRQQIVDGSISITTSFLKSRDEGSGYGGDWSVRANMENNNGDIPFNSAFFYLSAEDGSSFKFWPSGSRSSLFISGNTRDIGPWELHLTGKNAASVHYAGFCTEHMHNLTQLVQNSLVVQEGKIQLPDTVEPSSNVAIYQITSPSAIELDVTFISGSTNIQHRLERLTGMSLEKKLLVQEELFETRFRKFFALNDEELSDMGIEKASEVAKAALSNLLGGVSYFYGESLISIPPNQRSLYKDQSWTYWSAPLYSAVPCRSFFPRGFLWDEGFHQIIISKWDRNLTYDIVGHWLDLLNIDGWIPREQILGTEARVRVPSEFILQHTDNANPPTLFLPLHDIVLSSLQAEANGNDITLEKAFFERTYPRLEAWFKWFNTTQAGLSSGTFYWHGRETSTNKELNAKSLSSGLDDYPRASHPTKDERHVDLRCWMALAAKAMVHIAKFIGAPHKKYEETAELLSNFGILNELHYDPGRGRYYDYGNHTEKVKLDWLEHVDHRTGYLQREMQRVVYGRPKLQFVPHFGYVSLFPFLMKLIPAGSPVLLKQLELIRDEELLWTSYGLRSLSKTSSMYNKYNTEHDPPYWRGSVWINFNFLVLSSLKHYSEADGIYRATAASSYKELRVNLIRNIVRRYQEAGYLFEQYDNKAEGAGKGAKPFTGWTSLLVLIMAEQYPR